MTEVISCSTLGASALLSLDDDNNNSVSLLLAIHLDRGKGYSIAGWATIDATTGRTTAGECASTPDDVELPMDALRRVVNEMRPVETVVTAICEADVDLLCAHVGLSRRTVHDRTAHAANVSTGYINAVLSRAFPKTGFLSPAEFVDLEQQPHALSAFVTAIQFAYEHNETIVERIQAPRVHTLTSSSSFSKDMDMSPDALRQLDINSNGNNKDLMRLLNRCRTPMGRRAFRERLLTPTTDVEVLQGRYDGIAALADKDINSTDDIDTIRDIERIFRRVSLHRANERDLVDLAESLKAAARALRAFNDIKASSALNALDALKGSTYVDYKNLNMKS